MERSHLHPVPSSFSRGYNFSEATGDRVQVGAVRFGPAFPELREARSASSCRILRFVWVLCALPYYRPYALSRGLAVYEVLPWMPSKRLQPSANPGMPAVFMRDFGLPSGVQAKTPAKLEPVGIRIRQF